MDDGLSDLSELGDLGELSGLSRLAGWLGDAHDVLMQDAPAPADVLHSRFTLKLYDSTQ